MTKNTRTTDGCGTSPDGGPRAVVADQSEALPLTLTAAEVAAALRISRGSAYELIRSGAIPSLRLGGRTIRVARKALEDFLEEGARAR